jgi:integrase
MASGSLPLSTRKTAAESATWSQRYGDRHRLVRIKKYPAGIVPPRKVRVYRRQDHYVLQWWDPAAGKTLSDRVDGDLLAALIRARETDERILAFRRGGRGAGRISHQDLVDRYLADLARRADAGEVAPATIGRYRSALGHLLAFAARPDVRRDYPDAAKVDREFRLAFDAYLANLQVRPNGHPHAALRPLRGQAFVRDAARGLFEWAADPERGGLLPVGFRNPFRQPGKARSVTPPDPLADPDVTVPMAAAFVAACDAYQLRLFVPMIAFGLRAAEPCLLMREDVDADWLRVPCRPDLDHWTKGRRDKRLPLAAVLGPVWDLVRGGAGPGLLYFRRAVAAGRERPPLAGATPAELAAEYRQRCTAAGAAGAAARRAVRDAVLRDAGGLTYDHVAREFRAVAGRLGWPAAATPKDFRHLFCTALGNTPMPEGYRRYLMGHAPGRAAAVAYTHLTRVREEYAAALSAAFGPVVAAAVRRVAEVSAAGPAAADPDGPPGRRAA